MHLKSPWNKKPLGKWRRKWKKECNEGKEVKEMTSKSQEAEKTSSRREENEIQFEDYSLLLLYSSGCCVNSSYASTGSEETKHSMKDLTVRGFFGWKNEGKAKVRRQRLYSRKTQLSTQKALSTSWEVEVSLDTDNGCLSENKNFFYHKSERTFVSYFSEDLRDYRMDV